MQISTLFLFFQNILQIVIRNNFNTYHHVILHSILVKYKIFSISTFFKHLTRHFPILFADTSAKFLFQKKKNANS